MFPPSLPSFLSSLCSILHYGTARFPPVSPHLLSLLPSSLFVLSLPSSLSSLLSFLLFPFLPLCANTHLFSLFYFPFLPSSRDLSFLHFSPLFSPSLPFFIILPLIFFALSSLFYQLILKIPHLFSFLPSIFLLPPVLFFSFAFFRFE